MTESEIVQAVTQHFSTFGRGGSAFNSPISEALKNRPPMFAAGIDVAEVVRFVLERVDKNTT